MAKMANKQGSEKCRQNEHFPKSDENKMSKINFLCCKHRAFWNEIV
jgi:hypothetical protein